MEKGLQVHGDSLDYSIDQVPHTSLWKTRIQAKLNTSLNIIYSFLQTDPLATSFRPLC